ncbi:Putative Methyl-accepting chemotaxis protein with multiple PAS domains [Bradyrhizobium sp. ORS 285]|uniref:methyl-accepting chemotaxis protein n=1 Tax=Bradyrhizobium sp. ORS 285 TaxID=115808 RepID=UPI0002406291|nr:PAS domain-containing protein [Bradyrhizobium sp. ORS 285]CCD90099.1 putative Methyl-accepting chemotaxis protein with multiple PAS domains [Bradyrhizobium sp. ORS 285]SMX62210.1 Putative Methyl-accepting chemotaxis protein with multiple PAS domains [Bradyrhizobium sp. ORS 285]
MAFWSGSSASRDAMAQVEAINRSQAVIEFGTDGTIITANKNFLDAIGYSLAEIQGRHHSMFVSPEMRDSADYRAFWSDLRSGKFRSGEYKRFGKGNRPIWIQASYNPVLEGGKPVKIIKFASDLTSQKMRSIEDAGKIAAIGRVQAVIEFNLDGTILDANDQFLNAMGYSLAEIKGRHHSMFVLPGERDSAAYKEFWASLNRGEFRSGEFKRCGKDNKEVWILASYNPILDDTGRPFKVVKYASDVTQQKLNASDFAGQIAAIRKSQAVIEFDLSGHVLDANNNFLKTLGYTLAEIKGKHHRMFMPSGTGESADYREFWAALARGEFQSGEFERAGKGGRQVWIQATYNPIKDLNGKPFKIVKFATDVTSQVITRMKGDKVRGMMEHVAAGAEQLNSSVQQIADAMAKSKETATAAVTRVEDADQQAKRLSSAAGAMSSIVELIGSITGQINLLALNATIESARAGEAGRGFAVVAGEVKNLANQAKQATDRIGSEIGNLNGISSDVVGALDAIKAAIQSVNEYVSSTAQAVGEQSTVTSEMSSNMRQAAAEAATIGKAA